MRRPRKERKPEEEKESKEKKDLDIGKRIKERSESLKKETKYIATHTVTDKDTLSHVALKYYGNATRPYWMVIFEANKDVLGDEPPGKFYPGVEVKIPELPEELKKK